MTVGHIRLLAALKLASFLLRKKNTRQGGLTSPSTDLVTPKASAFDPLRYKALSFSHDTVGEYLSL
jgi:hypothetical protein